MPITHATIPVPPDKVGQTEWAEAHTLPTAGEIGALTTASAEALFLTPGSASAIYLLQQDASTTYARQTSAVTTAQLSVYLTSASASSLLAGYLLSQDASTTYARQASAVTTAQLAVYLLSQDASTTYARQTSAVTTAQLAVYLLAQDASTTYARQASAVTTAQLNNVSAGVLTSGTVALARLGSAGTPSSATFLRGDNTWQDPGAGGGITEASADAKYAAIVSAVTTSQANFSYGITKFVTADVTNATTVVTTLNDLIINCSASTIYALEGNLIWRSSAATTGISIQCSTTPNPGMYCFGAEIYGFGVDGAAGSFIGYASTNADPIICTSANAAPLNYPIIINGTIITPGSATVIQLCVASEVSGSGIVIRRGSWVRATRIGAA